MVSWDILLLMFQFLKIIQHAIGLLSKDRLIISSVIIELVLSSLCVATLIFTEDLVFALTTTSVPFQRV